MHRQAEEEIMVAAYCRVSTENDDQTNSFESQQRYFTRYIESHPGWKLFRVYADRGLSGTTTKNRKAFNQMLSDGEEGLFGMVITKEISRFARNTLDSIYYTRRLKKSGVGVIFLNDNINTLEGDAELRLSIMASIAQEESRRTSQRVKWGQKRRMEAGVVFGRKMIGYDLKGGQLVINEPEAETVRAIFEKYVYEEKGVASIAGDLKAEGVPPGGRIQAWSTAAVLRILKNEKYCGDLVQKKTFTPDYLSHEKKYNRGQEEKVVIRNHHQPIVSREIFHKAGEILRERGKSQSAAVKHSTRYMLSGKIRCGCCGANYVARVKRRTDGSCYFGWRCFEGTKHGKRHSDERGNEIGCNGPTVTNETFIRLLSMLVEKLQVDREEIVSRVLELIEGCILSDPQRESFGEEMQIKKERLIQLYLEGKISKEEYDRWTQKVEGEGTRGCGYVFSENCRLASDWRERREMIRERVSNLLDGTVEEDVFYRNILDRIVVFEDEHVEIYLVGLKEKVTFAVETQETRQIQ